MPDRASTHGYRMNVMISLLETNSYDEVIGEGQITFTKKIKATSLTHLATVLADIEALGNVKRDYVNSAILLCHVCGFEHERNKTEGNVKRD